MIENAAAKAAFEKRLPSFDWNEGDKKKAQVMIQAFEAGRGLAAMGTDPGQVIDLNSFRLYTADENEGAPPDPFPASF